MKSIEIQGKIRTEVGKKASKKLKKQGLVPCELYGGKENIHFTIEEQVINKLIYTPNVYIVNLDIEGKKHNAIVKSTQFNPVTDAAIHMDFVELFDDKKISVKIPVTISGSSIGIKNGGKLRLVKRHVTVLAIPKDLPDTLDIDITKLNIGDTIKIKDLSVEGLELKDNPSTMVVGIVSSRVSKSMSAEEDGVEEEVAEGEEAAEESTEG